MTVSILDLQTALIVVDLQKGVASSASGVVIANAARLAEAFRAKKLPVVLVNVAGGAPGRKENGGSGGERAPDWMDLLPELDQQPDDHAITKRTWGAFTNTNLAVYLAERKVTQVVVCGIATSIGVESTARQAHELGLNVAFATDAMRDGSPEAHANSIGRIFPRMGETGTTSEIIELLEITR